MLFRSIEFGLVGAQVVVCCANVIVMWAFKKIKKKSCFISQGRKTPTTPSQLSFIFLTFGYSPPFSMDTIHKPYLSKFFSHFQASNEET